MANEMCVMTFKLPQSLREKMKARAAAEERSESGFLRYHLGRLLLADEGEEEEMGCEIGNDEAAGDAAGEEQVV